MDGREERLLVEWRKMSVKRKQPVRMKRGSITKNRPK